MNKNIDIWKLVNLLSSNEAIGVNWVYKAKYNNNTRQN